MKKLFAWLTAMIIALTNNVGYELQGDVDFVHDAYYTIAEDNQPNYREIYGGTPAAGSNNSCIPTRFRGSGTDVIWENANDNYFVGKWINQDEKKTVEELDMNEYIFEEIDWIISPFQGTLLSSSRTSNGTSMVVEYIVGGNEFRLELENMERWWCCNSKVEPDFEDGTWQHTCDELKGTVFDKNDTLGRAKNGTKATLYMNNSKVSFNALYKQTSVT